jgi:hypothetical protein
MEAAPAPKAVKFSGLFHESRTGARGKYTPSFPTA